MQEELQINLPIKSLVCSGLVGALLGGPTVSNCEIPCAGRAISTLIHATCFLDSLIFTVVALAQFLNAGVKVWFGTLGQNIMYRLFLVMDLQLKNS